MDFALLGLVSACQGLEESMKDFGLLVCPGIKRGISIRVTSSLYNLTLAVASLLRL